MPRNFGLALPSLLAVFGVANAYWLMGANNVLTVQRMDPIISPGHVSGHVHAVLGGSNFAFQTSTDLLRQSECTSIPIPEDKSAYWYPNLYFQWANGSFTSIDGGAVIIYIRFSAQLCVQYDLRRIVTHGFADYLFSGTPGATTAFPDDFRMFSGNPSLRTYDPNSFAQQAVTFLCLDFNGVSTRHNGLPNTACPSGIRSQINFPSCWDGVNTDSPTHKTHVSFLSEGPDQGTCNDPNYPVVIARIFLEVYWGTSYYDQFRSQAMNQTQPYVFSYGDRTGYGFHADFINGWLPGVLQGALDNCNCDPYGDPTCCVQQGLFNMTQGQTCRITNSVDEQVLGTLPKLPGNNPVQEEGQNAVAVPDTTTPGILSPVYVYTGDTPSASGTLATPPITVTSVTASTTSVSSPTSISVPSTSLPPVTSSLSSSHATSTSTPPPVPTTSRTTTPNGLPFTISIPTITIPSITFSFPPLPTWFRS
ncbi:hypothetical protein BDN72DRAFT_894124 [Pluteus cervinus]|uniref:Uncharacterized protein n=1 Tax=Pluteus cervinus TaxID=181527 RepID=A0ACD3B5X4_9AGAR|nr:hypothetical protein BDN72DRAFT_894124 [Pluteus cervinus]